MGDLGVELMERGVPIEELPDSVTTRKLWLQELEVIRLIEDEDMPEEEANDLGRKQFEVLSDAEFAMEWVYCCGKIIAGTRFTRSATAQMDSNQIVSFP